MKKRNPLAVFFLSIITLGIYDLYWLVKTKKFLNQQTKTRTPTIWLLFSPVLFVIVLSIVLIIYARSSGSSPAVLSASANTTVTAKNALGELLVIILESLAWLAFVPITFYWFLKFSKSINEYTHAEMSTGLAFIMLWLLHFIGVAIVQDKFNDIIEAGQNPMHTPPASAGAQNSQLPPNPGSTPFISNNHDQAYGSSVFSPQTAAPQNQDEQPSHSHDQNQPPQQ